MLVFVYQNIKVQSTKNIFKLEELKKIEMKEVKVKSNSKSKSKK